MGLRKEFYRLLYHVTGSKRYKKYKNAYKEGFGKNNKVIIIDENGKSKEYHPREALKYKWLIIHWIGNNNTITIEMPTEIRKLEISLKCHNNNIYIGKRARGNFDINLFNDDNNITFGTKVSAMGMSITLNSGSLTIGDNCMCSGFVNILTDGHAVIDEETKECLNTERADIKIGNHVWLGFGTTILKKARIGDNCIVANSAVVTKPFDEENVVIAGNPAKIVKRGINWNSLSPVRYSKEIADFSF